MSRISKILQPCPSVRILAGPAFYISKERLKLFYTTLSHTNTTMTQTMTGKVLKTLWSRSLPTRNVAKCAKKKKCFNTKRDNETENKINFIFENLSTCCRGWGCCSACSSYCCSSGCCCCCCSTCIHCCCYKRKNGTISILIMNMPQKALLKGLSHHGLFY